jgi:putative acetyltransferase
MNERPYESADLPSVIETYTASIRLLAAPYYTPEQIAAWAPIPPDAVRWQERLAHLHTIVTESDGLLAGFASYTLDGYLDFLFTHPAFARHGVASSLYHRVESALRAVSTPKVTLLPALPHDPSSTATAFNSTARSASSAVGLTSDGLPCTSNSAMNESSNQSMQPTARVMIPSCVSNGGG